MLASRKRFGTVFVPKSNVTCKTILCLTHFILEAFQKSQLSILKMKIEAMSTVQDPNRFLS